MTPEQKRLEETRAAKLLDTGILNDDRYCDVIIEYAKNSPDDQNKSPLVSKKDVQEKVMRAS